MLLHGYWAAQLWNWTEEWTINCKMLCLVRCHICVLWFPVSLTVIWHRLTFLVFLYVASLRKAHHGVPSTSFSGCLLVPILVQTCLWTQLALPCCSSWKAFELNWLCHVALPEKPRGLVVKTEGSAGAPILAPALNSPVTLSKINQGLISWDLSFSSCKMEIIIVCTSEDWGVQSKDLIKKSLPNLMSWSFLLVFF